VSSAKEGCRIVGIACAILLSFTYIFTVWTPTVLDRAGSVKGWDFPQFYVLGELVAQGRLEAVSDGTALGAQARRDVSPTLAKSTFVPVYGPQIALLFAPLAGLSYLGALRCWIGLSILLYAICCVTLWRACASLKAHAMSVGILAIGSPALFFLVCY